MQSTASSEATYLVVDIDTVEVVLLDPVGEGVRRANRVRTGGGRDIGGAKDRHNELDTRSSVLGLDACALCGGQAGPLLGLVPGTLEKQE